MLLKQPRKLMQGIQQYYLIACKRFSLTTSTLTFGVNVIYSILVLIVFERHYCTPDFSKQLIGPNDCSHVHDVKISAQQIQLFDIHGTPVWHRW